MKTHYSLIKHNNCIAVVGLAIVITAGAIQQGLCAVGYVNTAMRKGWSLVVNPLDSPPNNADSIMASPPEGTSFYRFDSTIQNYKEAVTFFAGFGWCPVSGSKSDPALILNPGEGYWVESPQAWTNTFVGELLQGLLTNPIPAYYSLKGSKVPQAGLLQTDLKFPARQSDVVWKWLGLSFDPYDYDFGWFPTEPTLGVSEGFIVWRDPAQATQANWWVRNFSFLTAQAGQQLANSSSTAPQVHSMSIRSGNVTLNVRNGEGVAYNIQFSRDGQLWTTVATKVRGNSWSTPLPDGVQGFYQLANH